MRIEVQEFRRACDRLVRFAHQHHGLTEEEREVVVSFVQALDQEHIRPGRHGKLNDVGDAP